VQHIFVLGDQLTTQVGPLSRADPAKTVVLMVESLARGRQLPYHKQKLGLLYSAMRHFRLELEARGFTVDYRRCEGWEDGIRAHLGAYPGVTLTVMQPADWGVDRVLSKLVTNHGGELRVVRNELWLSTEDDWARYAKGKKQLRMEFFYRAMREQTGWLMDDTDPVGGQWNFDADNREPPPKHHAFPPKLAFTPDALTLETLRWVSESFPDHFGSLEGFNWPVTRDDGLRALSHFLEHRLSGFGPYEDAMLTAESQLYHSLLSPAINLGLLTAREVCEAALEYAERSAGSGNAVPLQSIEGFLRQILGWREFMRHVYRTKMPEFRTENRLSHHARLPELYWTGETDMNCLHHSISQLLSSGHTHHIQRLMVLGNFALLMGAEPQQVNEWFLLSYVDAYDWVVTPNVIGMSQYADLGSFTSKPYAAGGAYINRMSDYCAGCRYDPKRSSGDNACPFTTLYWDFVDRHTERFAQNPRMSMIVSAWKKRDPADKAAILERAAVVKRNLEAEVSLQG
jgi:deoxyribodipyrimidine photolyase-related protein